MTDRFSGADLGSAHGTIEIGADLRGIELAAQALTGFEQRSRSLDSALSGIARGGALFGAALAGGIGLAARSFVSFESQMLAVQAVSGATGEQFVQLSDLAKRIGQDTVFSATQAAQALEELAKAGVSVPDILSGAAEGATALAAAAGIGIPEAATLIATALNQFQLAGDQAIRVADIFANVANTSAADATSFGEALQYVGGVANNLGIPIEDVAAAVAALADQGIQGSMAGTNLAAALQSLVSPSKKALEVQRQLGLQITDNQGNFVGLDNVLQQLARATQGLSDVERQRLLNALIPEERAVRAITALLNTQTEEARAAGKSWDDYADAMRQSGTAAQNAQTRLSGVAGSIEQLRGSVETAAIEFGENLAPAIKAAAETLTRLTNAFSGLPEGVQTAAVGTAALASGLALVAAGGAKAVQTGINVVRTYRDLAAAIQGSATAMRLLSLAFNPVTIGLGAIAAISLIAIQRHRDHQRALRDLEQAYRDVADAVNELRLSGEEEQARILDETSQAVRQATEAVQEHVKALKEQRDAQLEIATSLFGTMQGERARKEYERLNAEIERLTISEDQQRAVQVALQQAFSDTRVDGEKLAKRVDELNTLYRNGLISTDQYVDALTKLPGQTARFAREQENATQATEEQAAASAQSAEDLAKQAEAEEQARKAAEQFAEQLDQIVTKSLLAQGALQDIAPELDGIQAGFGRASDTIEGTVLQLNKFGQVRLSKANREALELARTLEHVEGAITRTEEAIQNNEEDLGMWQDRIRFVTDVVGGNTDELDKWLKKLQNGEITQEEFNQAIDAGILGPLTKLDALLAQGRITQQEYNDAKAAALHLIKRSAGGIQDENAELVDNLIALDKYVTLHDSADGAVKNLTDEQRGFIAAMGEARVQTFLQTLQLLKFLEATGAIPPEKVTKFIADSSAADPVIAAVAKDLGLLEGDHEINLTADNANQVLDDLNGKATAFVSLDGKEVHVAVDTTRDALEFVKRNADALDGKEVTFTINGDDGPVTRTLEDLKAIFPEELAILLKFEPEGGTAGAGLQRGSMVGPGGRPLVPAIEPPPPVPVTATNQTQPAVDEAKATIGTVSETAASEGAETGEQFAAALEGTSGKTSAAVDTHRQALNDGFRRIASSSQAWGQAVGATFDISLANALASNANLVYDTAYQVAQNAYLGARAALGIRSPSRRAAELAGNFGQTFADVLAAQAQDAGMAFARLLATSLETGLSAPAVRSLVETRQPAAFMPVSAPGVIGAGRTTVLNVSPGAVQVAGVADPQRAADLAIERLYRVISRLDSGGAFA